MSLNRAFSSWLNWRRIGWRSKTLQTKIRITFWSSLWTMRKLCWKSMKYYSHIVPDRTPATASATLWSPIAAAAFTAKIVSVLWAEATLIRSKTTQQCCIAPCRKMHICWIQRSRTTTKKWCVKAASSPIICSDRAKSKRVSTFQTSWARKSNNKCKWAIPNRIWTAPTTSWKAADYPMLGGQWPPTTPISPAGRSRGAMEGSQSCHKRPDRAFRRHTPGCRPATWACTRMIANRNSER